MFYYSIDGDVWSTDVPTARDAGEYLIYFYIVSTDPACEGWCGPTMPDMLFAIIE